MRRSARSAGDNSREPTGGCTQWRKAGGASGDTIRGDDGRRVYAVAPCVGRQTSPQRRAEPVPPGRTRCRVELDGDEARIGSGLLTLVAATGVEQGIGHGTCTTRPMRASGKRGHQGPRKAKDVFGERVEARRRIEILIFLRNSVLRAAAAAAFAREMSCRYGRRRPGAGVERRASLAADVATIATEAPTKHFVAAPCPRASANVTRPQTWRGNRSCSRSVPAARAFRRAPSRPCLKIITFARSETTSRRPLRAQVRPLADGLDEAHAALRRREAKLLQDALDDLDESERWWSPSTRAGTRRHQRRRRPRSPACKGRDLVAQRVALLRLA